MKLFFKTLLIIHIISLLFVNIISFKHFTKTETRRLNSIGDFFLVNYKIDSIPVFIKNSIGLYSNITGTNRGYEFFSPNVSDGSVKLLFISEKGEKIKVLKSIESKVKLLTATYYFNTHIFNKNMKSKLLTSICSRIFTLNPQINEISVYIKVSKHKNLSTSSSIKYSINTKQILLSKISRNEN